MPAATRSSVTWSRSNTCGPIAALDTYDVPRSPRSSPPSQPKYCVASGRSRPNWRRSSATASSDAFTPSATRAGSPGSTAMNPNTSTELTPRLTKSTAVRSIRRRITVSRPGEAGQVEVLGDRVLRQTGQVLVRDDQVRQQEQPVPRRLLGQPSAGLLHVLKL